VWYLFKVAGENEDVGCGRFEGGEGKVEEIAAKAEGRTEVLFETTRST